MADSSVITCSECGKRFKGKGDLRGKKIRCPFCSAAFVVGGGDDPERTMPPRKEKPAAAPARKSSPPPKPAPAAAKPAAVKPPAAQAGGGDDDDEKNPYGITELDLAPRCPNCASEMESEEAVVCLYCGYNTLTREWGKTEKVIAHTGGEHFLYLLPGILCAVFILLQITGMLYYCLVLPYDARESFWSFADHESMRVWTTIGGLFDIWPLGYFAFNRLVLKPKPPEKFKE